MPHGPVSRWLDDLPVVFRESDFLGRLLLIFESLWEPLEQRQDQIEIYRDPRTSPADFLPWLASWMDLPIGTDWPETRVRRLLAEAMDLYRQCGTNDGLPWMIEVNIGLTPIITDHPTEPFVFHDRVRLPPGTDVSADMIGDVIRTHNPAPAAYEITHASPHRRISDATYRSHGGDMLSCGLMQHSKRIGPGIGTTIHCYDVAASICIMLQGSVERVQ